MNGIAEVKLRGYEQEVEKDGVKTTELVDKVIRLKFNMQAIATMEESLKTGDLLLTTTEGYSRFLSDLLYAGMFGQSIVDRVVSPKYEEVLDLFDLLSIQPDAADQYADMTNVYFAAIKDYTEKREALNPPVDKKKAK